MPSRAVLEELTRAFTTHLGDETTMTPIVDEGLQTVVSHTTLGASRRAGRQLVGQWVSPDRSSAYLGCTRPTLLMKTSTGYTTRYCGWSLGIRV